MSDASPNSSEEQSLFSHLIELRNRLLRAVLGVLILFVAMVPFANKIYSLVAKPLVDKLPAGATMVAIDVATPFLTPIKMAFFAALFAAMPWILYQLWAFVAPGLYRNEQKLAVPLLVSSVFLFYLGCAFAFFLVLPTVFTFLVGVTPEGVTMMTDISHYLDFVLLLFFAFGLCFEIPVATVILVSLGWVTPKVLAESRSYVIVGAFVIGAIVTPPDAISQIMLAVPMILLFEVGLIAARAVSKNKADEASLE